MNLPTLLQQLESGALSAAQAEQEIRDEIDKLEKLGKRNFGFTVAIGLVKAALELLTEIEKI